MSGTFAEPLVADGATLHDVEVVIDREHARMRLALPDGSTHTFGHRSTPTATPVPAPVVSPPVVTPPAVVAPKPPRSVRASRHGHRVLVTWRGVTGAASKVRCGVVSRTVRTSQATLRSRATHCKVRSVSDGGASPWVRVRVKRLDDQAT